MHKLILALSALAFSAVATQASAQAPAETPCQVEAAKSRAVNNARLGLNPMPADPRYDLSVDEYSRSDKNLVGLRAWIKANPRHLCAPDAQALLAPREARIQTFSATPTAGAQPAKRIGSVNLGIEDYPPRSTSGGTVAVKLFVEADGKVEECIVTISSGDSRLDAQTCRLLPRRARFEPARDTRGSPVSSWFEQKMVWAPLEQ
jgi:TonB family protein